MEVYDRTAPERAFKIANRTSGPDDRQVCAKFVTGVQKKV